MAHKLVISPTCSDPEKQQSGVIIKNFFVPTYEAPGMVIDCGLVNNTQQPTMQVTWPQMSSWSGTYVLYTDKTHTYYRHTSNTYAYIGRAYNNTNRWVFCEGSPNSDGLFSGWFYCYNDNGDYDNCPKTGWYDDYWYGSTNNDIVVDLTPTTVLTMQVTNCGPNAKYKYDYIAGLNVNGACNQVLRNKELKVNYFSELSSLTTTNITSYVADVYVLDNMIESDPEYIYRCNFSTGQIRRIPFKKYVAPSYTVLS